MNGSIVISVVFGAWVLSVLAALNGFWKASIVFGLVYLALISVPLVVDFNRKSIVGITFITLIGAALALGIDIILETII